MGSSFAFRDLSCSYETLPAHVALGAALEVEPQAQPLQTADEAVVAQIGERLARAAPCALEPASSATWNAGNRCAGIGTLKRS